MRERKVLGQSLSMVQIQGRDMVWGLDTGLRCGLVLGRYDWRDINRGQVLDTSEDPDTNWGWVPVRGRSECRDLDWT